MSASPPTASELWHRSESTQCAMSGLMQCSNELVGAAESFTKTAVPQNCSTRLSFWRLRMRSRGKSLPAENGFHRPPRSFRDPKPSANEEHIFSFLKLDHPCPK